MTVADDNDVMTTIRSRRRIWAAVKERNKRGTVIACNGWRARADGITTAAVSSEATTADARSKGETCDAKTSSRQLRRGRYKWNESKSQRTWLITAAVQARITAADVGRGVPTTG